VVEIVAIECGGGEEERVRRMMWGVKVKLK
jgi:hypothetical protein